MAEKRGDPLMGERIATKRRALGMSQTELADRLGVAQSLVSQWEHGVKHPGGRKLVDLAKALSEDVEYLHGGVPGLSRELESTVLEVVRAAGPGAPDLLAKLSGTDKRDLGAIIRTFFEVRGKTKARKRRKSRKSKAK